MTLGDVTASVIWCFNNDGMLSVGGDVVADLFAPDQEHACELEGEVRARAVAEDYCSRERLIEQLAPWLPADYILSGKDKHVDYWRVLEEAAAGHSPVLDTPRPITP